jgi:uncharacterized SAM-binding protein YcdF (DUF218 family)
MFKRIIAITIVALIFITLLCTTFAVNGNTWDTIKQESSKTGTKDSITQTADEAITNMVSTARQVGVLVLIGVIVFAAYAFFFAGAKKIAEYKVHAAIIILALIFLFKTESIVATALKFIGYTIQ